MEKNNWTQCPHCKFPALYSEFQRYVGWKLIGVCTSANSYLCVTLYTTTCISMKLHLIEPT